MNYYLLLYKGNCIEDSKESLKDIASVFTKSPAASNKSIENLKNALDRATEIICSTTPSKIYNSKLDLNNIQECQFENLYGIKDNDNQEKVIEKSISSNENFLGMDEIKNAEANNETSHEIFNQAFINSQMLNFSTTKTSIESETSAWNQQSINSHETNQAKIPIIKRILSTPQKVRVAEREYINTRTTLNSAIKDSPRRRSLPARLNNLAVVYTPKTMYKKVNMQRQFYIVIMNGN